jgi:hypothetical protein
VGWFAHAFLLWQIAAGDETVTAVLALSSDQARELSLTRILTEKMDINEFTNENTGPFPDCSKFHDRFARCLQPNTQIAHIYKHAGAENCGEFVHDWRKCMEAKFTKDAAKIKVMIAFLLRQHTLCRVNSFYCVLSLSGAVRSDE